MVVGRYGIYIAVLIVIGIGSLKRMFRDYYPTTAFPENAEKSDRIVE